MDKKEAKINSFRIITIMVLLLAVLFFCSAASAESGKWGNLSWSLSNGTLTISGTGEMKGFSGVYDKRAWHPYSESITKVIIQNGITNIGWAAFYGCSNLTKVTIPESITTIGISAFNHCCSLTAVTIPKGVKTIEKQAFQECSSLTKISIPESVISIDKHAFSGCKSLTKVSIPNSVTAIAGYTFSECTNLKTVTIPNSVTTIAGYAFSECTNLKNIIIPNSINTIYEYAFNKCSSLQSITIPDSVTSIKKGTFSNCPAILYANIGSEGAKALGKAGYSYRVPGMPFELRQVGSNYANVEIYKVDRDIVQITIPECVTRIAGYAFDGCNCLASIEIPDHITKIGEDAFFSCPAIRYANISSEGAKALGKAGYSYRIPGAQYNLRQVGSDYTDVEIERADEDIERVAILKGVTRIGNSAFSNCGNLISIEIPDSVTHIGNDAFSECYNLRSIEIPDSVTSLGYYMFYNCSNLTSIYMPDHITTFHNSDFYNCPAILYTTIGSESAKALGKIGCSFRIPGKPFDLIQVGNDYTDVEICKVDKDLLQVTIPEDVTRIGNSAFSGCSNLTSIEIPDRITNIGSNAFSNCPAIRYANIGSEGAKALGKAGYSFQIPGKKYSLKHVGNNYTGLEICEADKDIIQLTIPENVTSIGNNAFYDCYNLTSIEIPDSVTTIGSYAFYGCSRLLNIDIPNGVANIDAYAFYGCVNPTSITIPASVISIGNYAFYQCNKVSKVEFLGENEPITFGSGVFSSNPTVYCYKYTDAYYWANNNTYNMVFLDETDPEENRTVKLPDDFRIAQGDTLSLGNPAFPLVDHPVVEWESSDPKVLKVENGVLTAIKKGNATITASVGSVSDSVIVTVYIPATSFELDKSECWLVAEETLQLNIENITPSDAEMELKWSSSNNNAIVSNDGYVTTRSPGETDITVLSERGVRRKCKLNICYPVSDIQLPDSEYNMEVGDRYQLKANVIMRSQSCENRLVSFTSSDSSVAEVNQQGLITAKGFGIATITVKAEFNSTATASMRILVGVCGEENGEPVTHNWGSASYEWNTDNTKVTATRICTRDPSHIDTETVTTTAEITKDATCETKGETTYTSNQFTHEGFSRQTRTVDDIPALGHDWQNTEYKWADDGSSCMATHSCGRCELVVSESGIVTSEQEQAPTCCVKGKTKYTAVFNKEGFTQQITTIEDLPINPDAHSWNEASYIVSADYTSVTATHSCKHNESHTETETVEITSVIVSPTETSKGTITYTSDEFTTEGFDVWTMTLEIPSLSEMSVLRLPDQLVAVEDEAFSNLACEAVIIPDGCTFIGESAFVGCVNLRYVRIPASIITYPDSAFSDCNEDLVIDWAKE